MLDQAAQLIFFYTRNFSESSDSEIGSLSARWQCWRLVPDKKLNNSAYKPRADSSLLEQQILIQKNWQQLGSNPRLLDHWSKVAHHHRSPKWLEDTRLVPGQSSSCHPSLRFKDCASKFQVKYLEHVQAHVTMAATKRGDVQISLTSPRGTKSLLIDKRPKDYSRGGFNDWPFLTVTKLFCSTGLPLARTR